MASQPRISTGTYKSRAVPPIVVLWLRQLGLRGRKPKRFAVGWCLREVYVARRRTRSSIFAGRPNLKNNTKKGPTLRHASR